MNGTFVSPRVNSFVVCVTSHSGPEPGRTVPEDGAAIIGSISRSTGATGPRVEGLLGTRRALRLQQAWLPLEHRSVCEVSACNRLGRHPQFLACATQGVCRTLSIRFWIEG